MQIELKIDTDELILLNPIKKSEEGASEVIYQLMDETDKSWMSLQLVDNSFKIRDKDIRITEEEDDIYVKLNQLVLDVIEAEQSGTEINERQGEEVTIPYNPEKIKIHSKAFPLRLISDMIDSKDIDLSPDFQRNFVWNNQQKSRLIESILLRIPLPMFYFSEDEEGRITVVDGLKRLTTIKKFIDNEFPLSGLEYLQDTCKNRYYSDKNKDGTPNGKKGIDAKYFRWFNQTQFSVNVIDPSSPVKVKYDIFRRINTSGKPLNNQEIRNCLASSILRETLKQMVNLPEFISATDNSIKSTRMEDQEVALRFIMFSLLYKEGKNLNGYNGYMNSSLDDITENIGKLKKEELNKYVSLFSNAMQNAEYLLGRKYAFRKIYPSHISAPASAKQLINKALFVSCSVLLSAFDPKQIQVKNDAGSLLLPLAEKIKNDEIFFAYLSYGTNSKANLQYVFYVIEHLIINHLKN